MSSFSSTNDSVTHDRMITSLLELEVVLVGLMPNIMSSFASAFFSAFASAFTKSALFIMTPLLVKTVLKIFL